VGLSRPHLDILYLNCRLACSALGAQSPQHRSWRRFVSVLWFCWMEGPKTGTGTWDWDSDWDWGWLQWSWNSMPKRVVGNADLLTRLITSGVKIKKYCSVFITSRWARLGLGSPAQRLGGWHSFKDTIFIHIYPSFSLPVACCMFCPLPTQVSTHPASVCSILSILSVSDRWLILDSFSCLQ